jgi:Dolichyl-phosphate-mannose-protein mannosyltransferase
MLLLAGAARTAATFRVLSITFDEPAHYTAGLEYLTDRAYRLETEQPPLELAMGALIPYAMGARSSPEIRLAPKVPARRVAALINDKEVEAQLPPDARSEETLARMRWGVLPFFLIAGLVVYEWTRYTLGKPAAVLATALFTLTPPVLAHAGLATTDIALTACLTAAFLSLLRWAEVPSAKRALMLGLWTALAVLSKFTALLYLPAAALFALAGFVALERPGMARLGELVRGRLTGFAIAMATAVFLIWGGYWFSFGSAPWSAGLRMPAPELFDGIRTVLEHNRAGHGAFLLGQASNHGFWYFFPVALAVKTPLAVLLLAAIGLASCWKRHERRAWTAIAFAAGILAPAMLGSINIGVRHVLPVYASFAMLGALGTIELAKGPRAGRLAPVAAGLLLAWLAASGIRQHPDYLAYFNELADARPEQILADSDLDWGQDAKRAAVRLRELGATQASVFFSNDFAKDQFTGKLYGFPPLQPFQNVRPNSGWNVISPTSVAVFDGGWHASQAVQYGGRAFVVRPWYDTVEPTERVGALLLYYVPPAGWQVRTTSSDRR